MGTLVLDGVVSVYAYKVQSHIILTVLPCNLLISFFDVSVGQCL